MKKILMILMFAIGTLSVQAADYTYLTFETTDGAKVSVAVSGLSISISGTTLTAGSQSFTLTNLSKMYFSGSDETTAIEAVTTAELNDATDIYDLNGHKVQKDQMRRGVYIIKTQSGTHKIAVK
ncbi:MAG: hypothetical protein IJ580_07870 [Prevotella sp.]|nr:hypothetical protein [Prevotella sp.]